MVDREDTTFADSTYPYASAGGCNCVVSCQPWKGYFNISTVGTGLRFGYQVTWITSGWQPGISDFTRNADSTRIWARCGGYCGGCSPDGPLYLYYNADDVVDDGNTVYPDCV
ncbi:A disintegrin and metalloproteinase with thrombospondin motifs 9-like [Mercenaria mercenaria]|uniref:A disintegrin and metalloproteinase with thrombospondin motifs 9-like n=1 Tax=Mercenaria mercenaria TaxID=6596 RepID=UPI00234E495D|nr:A disintegrin and metalloproteinase with thrombospondin motifs 9-like [Mercenaria mercenaria]